MKKVIIKGDQGSWFARADNKHLPILWEHQIITKWEIISDY